MENRKATEAGQDITMQKEDFAALWKTIHLKVEFTFYLHSCYEAFALTGRKAYCAYTQSVTLG